MASLQKKGDAWYCQFTFRKQRYTFTIGKVEEIEARSVAAKVEYILMRIKQHLLDLPAGMNIVTFIQHDGKPPANAPSTPPPQTTLAQLRDSFLKTFSNGAVEENTLYTARIHLNHLGDTLKESFPMNALTLADLQRHVSRRQPDVAAVTIRKEIDTLRSAWNWGVRMGMVEGPCPTAGLVYPKSGEKLPFMTRGEIERRIAAGGDADELWEALYLTAPEITEFLDFAKVRKAPPWVYPMCLTAAHTGARRSELLRMERQDVDFTTGILTIREKKRVKGRLTTRRVPMSDRLKESLAALPDFGAKLFGPRSVQAAQQAFERIIGKRKSNATTAEARARKEAKQKTKWSVMKGYHVLRHSFISALANRGIDQRIIDEMVGHQSEQQRRRYRHLYPQTVADAIKLVFG